MPRRRTVVCSSCSFMLRKRDTECENCGAWTAYSKRRFLLATISAAAAVGCAFYIYSVVQGFGVALMHH